MSLSCRDQLKPCCFSPSATVVPPQALLEITHLFSGSILEFSLQGAGGKRVTEAPTVLVLKVCDMQIINPTIC